ncbi:MULTISPECIES: Lrp/AsnC family transcriptional regulator [unclassified Janthinobacterium]|jgi:Lrp/AsnC family transcriptional regulator, leucine-responsive regulatory protein|uniref:Lrp/AsnC family transcriptional regulator n=1 Tax=unclassified Janthinobacterium TaxID=2610881 RepID=UPI0016202F68|nr:MULTISPECIES: Lrp/AsnC family transcriptional regulator [unclassified Janthinobacterium]MBB5370218.1 DNA-binding Lrp family transcriptional regulator [Janthinobacterium sp. K2C7]MBB5383024.1 DNA-binding Lrp family transcriptional regulator [Janthinobacterium sp. K2Li3]MBB5388497.1 DNA-binding Lrp family transcriptional regulator [Janthinobacterium sp. K2E3]MBB5605640.1 DNA-binding Lrp family transcriptional regulator [Janthinobacterium sp. S3T4]MBB5611441.1 DNA-binding Lrp family transcript
MKISDVSLDATDLQILRLLQEEGRLSNARLAERLKLSETPVWRRLRRLEEEGFITGYQALLNRKKLGIGLVAFVRVVFANHGNEQPSQFEQAILSIPEILSCHNVAGEADYFLQVVARDLETYGEFVSTVLRRLPGVAEIQSSLSMREIKSSNRLPLPLA